MFENFIKTGIYETFISEVVLAEIQDTQNIEKRNRLLNIVKTYPLEVLELTSQEEDEAEEMAFKYIDAKIIPANKEADAFHIAISLIRKMDFLISWNYKHLANINREKKIKILNWENNYTNDFRIITPLELIDYGS